MKTSLLQVCKMILNRVQKSIVFFVSVLIIITLTSVTVFSQNTKELNQTIQLLQKSTTSFDQLKAENLKELVYDIQPTLYIINREVKTTGEVKPLVGELEISDISTLYLKNSIFEKVEILKIRVLSPTQAKTILNIPLLADFKSLKYIQFVFSYSISLTSIEALYVPDSRVAVLYSIEIPE